MNGRLSKIRSVASAAAHDEMVTWQRVHALEQWAGWFSQEMDLFIGQGFWSRLRWLFLGGRKWRQEEDQSDSIS